MTALSDTADAQTARLPSIPCGQDRDELIVAVAG